MKKRAFLAIVLVLILVVSSFGGVIALAEDEDPATPKGKGTVEGLTAKDDGFYYTNSQFTYTKNEDATSIAYWTFNFDDFNDTVKVFEGGIKKYLLENLTQATVVNDDEVEIDATVEEYFVFADYYADGETDDLKYSAVSVVYVDTTAPIVDQGKLIDWLLDPENETGFENSWLSGKDDWEYPIDWAYDVDIVSEKTAVDGTSNKSDMLNVYLQYLTSGDYYDGEWNDTEGSKTLDLTSAGMWRFRFVVADAAGNFAVLDNDQINNSEKTYVYETQRNVRDLTKPSIYYTTTQKRVSTIGTVAGVTYSIPTPTYSDDMSSTKVTYEVQKLVDGSWVVIFDSATGVVTEGFEDYVTSGSITPGLDEVTTSTNIGASPTYNYTYKLVHKATDSYGNYETAELNILVIAPDTDPYDVWKIVLISVACVAAAGIIVLLFIKPKEYTIVYTHGADPVIVEQPKAEKAEPAAEANDAETAKPTPQKSDAKQNDNNKKK